MGPTSQEEQPMQCFSRWATRVVTVALCAAASWSRSMALTPPHPRQPAQAAPDSFRVALQTSRGRFVVTAHRRWAPNGVDRFYYLVKHQYFDGVRFFRVVKGFMVQFGISGDPAVSAQWKPQQIPDDAVRQSNERGIISFASAGPNTRTTQLFINLVNNRRLNSMGFAPIAAVVDGMAVVDSLYAGYGEGPPGGNGPSQDRIASEGNAYLQRDFPKLDYIKKAQVVREWPPARTGARNGR
jgi:peptidyl-prolyl cis-trans isomerase A (cyclophilin A)